MGMRKMIGFSLLLLLLAGCAQPSASDESDVAKHSSSGGADAQKEAEDVQVIELTTREETDLYAIDVSYPQIEGLSDESIQKSWNDDLASVEDEVEAIKASASETEDQDPTGTLYHPYELSVEYSVYQNDTGILSIVMDIYEYVGGAHGMDVRQSFNYDLGALKQLSLSDVFGEGTDYESIINDYIDTKIQEDPENYFQTSYGFQSIDVEQPFVFSDEGIVIYFQEYEIAPYISGLPEFTIPFSTLEGVLKTEYLPQDI